MKRLIVFLLCLALLSTLNCAIAEEEAETSLGEQEPCELLTAGPVTTWTAPVWCKGEFAIQPFLIYNRTRGIFDSDSSYVSLPNSDKKYQFQQLLFVQFGITDKLEIDGQVGYEENYVKENGESASSNGLDDSYLFLRYCAVEETKTLPCVTGICQLLLPTGKYEDGDPDKLGTDITGYGSYDPGIGIIMTKTFKPLRFHLDAIASFPIKTDIDDIDTRYGNYLNYDFGLEYLLPKGFNLLLEFNGLASGDTEEDGGRIEDSNENYFIGGLGIGWSCEKIQTLLAYQRTLLGTNTDANDSVIFTFVYIF